MLNRLILKVTKFQLPPPKRLGTVVKNILGAIMPPPPPPPMSNRVKGEPKMDYDAFFIRVREGLIELISRELNNRNLAKIQVSIWIRFTKDDDV